MGMLLFMIGCLVGGMATAIGCYRLLIGTLRIARDADGEQYLFLELSDSKINKINNKKYVVLKVDPEVKFSQK